VQHEQPKPVTNHTSSWKTTPGSSSPAGITQWLKKLGISSTEFRTWTGGMGFKQFLEANPIWNLRGFVGLMLEHIDQRPA
jgi:hypothetical protein